MHAGAGAGLTLQAHTHTHLCARRCRGRAAATPSRSRSRSARYRTCRRRALLPVQRGRRQHGRATRAAATRVGAAGWVLRGGSSRQGKHSPAGGEQQAGQALTSRGGAAGRASPHQPLLDGMAWQGRQWWCRGGRACLCVQALTEPWRPSGCGAHTPAGSSKHGCCWHTTASTRTVGMVLVS